MTTKHYEYVLPVGTVLVSKSSSDGKERQYTIEQVVNGKPLQKGQKVKLGYEVKPVLGQGGFGITYLASRRIKDGNIDLGAAYYAIKEFFVKGSCYRDEGSTIMKYSPAAAADIKESLKDFKEEANRLKEICKGNPNIVNVNEVFEANGTAYYVMEFLEGESLRNLVKRTGPLSEGVALSYIRPIAEAIDYIHTQHRLLHLDIKPDNIMLRKGEDGQSAEPVLIDFGVSVHFNKKGDLTTTHHSTGVSEGYSPQEQYGGVAKIVEDRRRAHKDGFTSVSLIPCEVDVYALGATLYYILVGTNPYGAFTMNENIIREKLPQTISDKTRQVILNAMRTSASARTQTAAEFLKGFSDRYTLPRGYVLRSPNARYLITDILEESDCYIRYGATLFSGSQTDESGNATTKRRYTVFERFNQKRYKRLKDESVSCSEGSAVVKSREQQDFLAVCKKHIGMGNDGEADFDSSIIVREIFDTNGTSYAVVKQGWKPEPPVVGLLKKILEFFRRNIKQISILVFGFLMMAFGANYIFNQCNQPQKEEPEPQKETIARVENHEYEVPGIGKGFYRGLLDSDSLPHDPNGEIVFDEDKVYRGPFEHGKLEGSYASYSVEGQIFSGSFKDNQYAKGELTNLNDGSYYSGTFLDGKPYDGAWFTKDHVETIKVAKGKYVISN